MTKALGGSHAYRQSYRYWYAHTVLTLTQYDFQDFTYAEVASFVDSNDSILSAVVVDTLVHDNVPHEVPDDDGTRFCRLSSINNPRG